MRFAGWVLVSGCGLFEGVEEPIQWAPCVVRSEVAVTDPGQDVGFLAPLGDRLDAVVGEFPVAVTQAEPAEATWSGTLTLTQSGGIVAVDQEVDPTATGIAAGCPDGYRVPVLAALDLDGGEFHLALPLLLEVTDDSPAVRGDPVPDEDGDTWRALGDTDLSTTLDLRYASTHDFVEPELVTLTARFDDGVTPSGDVEFVGVFESPNDAELEGTQVSWASLSF